MPGDFIKIGFENLCWIGSRGRDASYSFVADPSKAGEDFFTWPPMGQYSALTAL